MIQFAERLVALRESSSPSTLVRHVGRRFSPYPYSVFYYVRLRRFRPLFTGAFLACALGTSVVPSPPPFSQFHAVHYFQARESVGTSSNFTWPVASACLGNAAFPSRDRRGSSAQTSKRDASIFCAGHGNLFTSHPPYDAGDLRRGYRRLVPCRLFWLWTGRRAGLLVKPPPVPLSALELLSSTITSGAPGFAKPHQCRYISEILLVVARSAT